LQLSWQALPEDRLDGQLPREPFEGADTAHDWALTAIGMMSKSAASHPIILAFIIFCLRLSD
jgi:hypothetical protein